MNLLSELAARQSDPDRPFLVSPHGDLTFRALEESSGADLTGIRAGDVVGVVGDFDAGSIKTLLSLFSLGAIVVPLTRDTAPDHAYFAEASGMDWLVEGTGVPRRLREAPLDHPMLEVIRQRGTPGLILFSSGTSGRPKAILHDFSAFLARFRTPRPALRTLNFLLFDHIGGINTLLHTLYNQGLVMAPTARSPEGVWTDIRAGALELLPTTPTFLRMLLMSGVVEALGVPPSLKVVTYGTERMDEGTLKALCALMPDVDFRQTYGMSELGILRVKSRARDSLWMKVGGEGVETRVDGQGVLHIRSESRMIGYLNAESPFDGEDWYNTRDLVEQDGEWIRVVGRTSDVISVGGIKTLPEEIERAALLHGKVLHAAARGVPNPITGQHIELTVQPREGAQLSVAEMREHMGRHVNSHIVPHRIRIGTVDVNHRFKRK